MTSSTRFCMLVTLLLASVVGCDDREADVSQVKECFAAYKAASIDADGVAAEKCVSQVVVELFASLGDIAQMGDRATINALPIFRKLLVLLLKHELEETDLDAMTGEDLFRIAFERGWIGDPSWVAGVELGEITMEEKGIAVAELLERGESTEESIQFVLEERVWKLDLAVTLGAADRWEKEQMNASGWPENRYLFDRIERITGRAVSDKIFDR